MELTAEEKQWVDDEMTNLLKGSTNWRKTVDPKTKKPYYYNKANKVTQWKLPEEFLEREAALKEQALSRRPKPTVAAPKAVEVAPPQVLTFSKSSLAKATSAVSAEPAVRKNEQIGAAEDNGYQSDDSHRTEPLPSDGSSAMDIDGSVGEGSPEEEDRINDVLSCKDSILEQDAVHNAQKLIRVYKKSPKVLIEKLAGTYSGYPQMCRVLMEVLSFAQGLDSHGSDQTKSAASAAAQAVDPEKIALEHFSTMIKQRFNKKQADEILLKYDHSPSWIKDMIHNESMRGLLTDLAQRHRDSSFLRFCMKEMSVLGYGNKHSAVSIAAELDGVSRMYALFTELVVKCLAGDEAQQIAVVEELSTIVKADKDLLALATFECQRLRDMIRLRDPGVILDDLDEQGGGKRPRLEEQSSGTRKTAFLHSDRLERVVSALNKLETANKKQLSANRRPVDIQLMKKKLQEDDLLRSLVVVMESESCSAQDMQSLHLSLGVSLETAPSWSQMRFYWASPKLQNVLIELFLAGRADTLQLIARAAVVSDLLPQMLDGLCEVSSVPSTKKDCQDLLDGTYDFCRWKDETIAQISADMPRLIGLLKNVTGMIYGSVDNETIQEVTALVKSRRIFAQCFLQWQWLNFSYSRRSKDSSEEQSLNNGIIISVWAQLLRSIAHSFSLLGADIFSCVELLLEAVASGTESDDLALQSAMLMNIATAKKDLLTVLVDVVHSGYAVEDTCKYLMSNADSFDAVTMRQVMHMFLVGMKRSLWQEHAPAFIELLCLPSVARAINNVHFKKEGIENLRSLIAGTNENSFSETVQGKMKELQNLLK